jgi:hypothetical protein
MKSHWMIPLRYVEHNVAHLLDDPRWAEYLDGDATLRQFVRMTSVKPIALEAWFRPLAREEALRRWCAGPRPLGSVGYCVIDSSGAEIDCAVFDELLDARTVRTPLGMAGSLRFPKHHRVASELATSLQPRADDLH